jgi:uncharacterized protein YjbJ (UPF0337 family)
MEEEPGMIRLCAFRPCNCSFRHGKTPRRTITMKDSTKDQAEGKFHEVKGAVKEKIGHATDNPNLEDEGTAEKVAGKVQKKVGQVEKVIEK